MRSLVKIGCIWLLATSCAMAHDGGFGHSRRTIAALADATGWTIEYRITHNPDEALVELAGADSDGDGRLSETERREFCTRRAAALLARLKLLEAGETPLRYESCTWGSALTQTYRFRADTLAAALTLTDDNFQHKPGLVRLVPGPGVTLHVEKSLDLSHAEHVRVRLSREK